MKTIIIIQAILIISFETFSQGVGINETGTIPDPSAILDVSSTTKGTLITRMTAGQRDAIPSPALGLQIFNTTNNCLQIYINSTWQNIYCSTNCSVPGAPTSGTNTPSSTQIIWNWNAVTGATGYKYNTVNNYATATDHGTNLSYTQTGLSCNTAYTLYIWAYDDACGESEFLELNQTTSSCICPTPSVTFNYRGSSVTYGTVGSVGRCWLDRDLGASQVATSSTDALAYGDLFQWGRLDDNHQDRASSTTTTLSGSDIPGHNNFITTSVAPHDWRNGQNNALWQGGVNDNNPCPTGYRLPTNSEWDIERLSWTSNDAAGAYNSPLRLPVNGSRLFNNTFSNVGIDGKYWSSTISGTNSMAFNYSPTNSGSGASVRSVGTSVRCIKN